MCPRSEKQFEEVRRKSRRAILDSALNLFAAGGYSRTTIDRIAHKAGISKGLIYNYFSGKDEILESLIDRFAKDVLPSPGNAEDIRDPGEFLTRILHRWFLLIKSNPSLIILGAQVHTDTTLRKLVRKKQLEYEKEFIPLFVDLFRRLGAKDPEVETLLLGSILDGVGLNYAASPEAFPLDRIERYLVRHYCAPKRRAR